MQLSRMMAIAALVIAAPMAKAQVSSAPCYEWNYGNWLGGGDEVVITNNQLGFTFPGPGGISVTSVDISSNGFIWLGAHPGIGARCCNGSGGQFVVDPPSIAAMWEDLDSTTSGSIFFSQIPGSPARAVITWERSTEFFNGPVVTMQVQLLDNGEIIIYHEQGNSIANHVAVMGVTQGNGAVPNPVQFSSARSTPIDTGNNPTAYQEFFNFNYDIAGKSFEFIPNGQGGYQIYQRTACELASTTTFGIGCPSLGGQTLYEQFQPNTLDLSNSSIAVQMNGQGGWVAFPGSGQFYTGFSNNLNLGDDDIASGIALPWPWAYNGGFTQAIDVSSNGFIWFDPNYDSRCCEGNISTFLSSPASLAGLWMDLYPPGGGGVYADADPNGTAFYITWSNVPEFYNQGSNTFQIALFIGGGFELRYQSVANLSHSALVGVTSGNGSSDPGGHDISATLPFDTGRGGAPLRLDATGGAVPQIGTTFGFDVHPIPSGTAVGAMLFGLNAVGRDLAPLGMPGCKGYVDFLTPGATSTVIFPVLGQMAQYSMNIPSATWLVGVDLYAQAATLSPGFTPLGVIASNGIQLHIGS